MIHFMRMSTINLFTYFFVLFTFIRPNCSRVLDPLDGNRFNVSENYYPNVARELIEKDNSEGQKGTKYYVPNRITHLTSQSNYTHLSFITYDPVKMAINHTSPRKPASVYNKLSIFRVPYAEDFQINPTKPLPLTGSQPACGPVTRSIIVLGSLDHMRWNFARFQFPPISISTRIKKNSHLKNCSAASLLRVRFEMKDSSHPTRWEHVPHEMQFSNGDAETIEYSLDVNPCQILNAAQILRLLRSSTFENVKETDFKLRLVVDTVTEEPLKLQQHSISVAIRQAVLPNEPRLLGPELISHTIVMRKGYCQLTDCSADMFQPLGTNDFKVFFAGLMADRGLPQCMMYNAETSNQIEHVLAYILGSGVTTKFYGFSYKPRFEPDNIYSLSHSWKLLPHSVEDSNGSCQKNIIYPLGNLKELGWKLKQKKIQGTHLFVCKNIGHTGITPCQHDSSQELNVLFYMNMQTTNLSGRKTVKYGRWKRIDSVWQGSPASNDSYRLCGYIPICQILNESSDLMNGESIKLNHLTVNLKIAIRNGKDTPKDDILFRKLLMNIPHEKRSTPIISSDTTCTPFRCGKNKLEVTFSHIVQSNNQPLYCAEASSIQTSTVPTSKPNVSTVNIVKKLDPILIKKKSKVINGKHNMQKTTTHQINKLTDKQTTLNSKKASLKEQSKGGTMNGTEQLGSSKDFSLDLNKTSAKQQMNVSSAISHETAKKKESENSKQENQLKAIITVEIEPASKNNNLEPFDNFAPNIPEQVSSQTSKQLFQEETTALSKDLTNNSNEIQDKNLPSVKDTKLLKTGENLTDRISNDNLPKKSAPINNKVKKDSLSGNISSKSDFRSIGDSRINLGLKKKSKEQKLIKPTHTKVGTSKITVSKQTERLKTSESKTPKDSIVETLIQTSTSQKNLSKITPVIELNLEKDRVQQIEKNTPEPVEQNKKIEVKSKAGVSKNSMPTNKLTQETFIPVTTEVSNVQRDQVKKAESVVKQTQHLTTDKINFKTLKPERKVPTKTVFSKAEGKHRSELVKNTKLKSKKQNVDTEDLTIPKPESTETKNAVAKRLDSGKPKVTDAPKEVASSTQMPGPAEKIKVESKKQNVDTKDLKIPKPESTETKNAVAKRLDSGKPKVTDAPKEVASSTQMPGPAEKIKVESKKQNVDTKDLKIPKPESTETKNAVAKRLDSGKPKVTDAPKEVASSTQTTGPAEKIKVESKKQNVDTKDLTILKPKSTERKNAVAEPLDSGKPKVTDAPKEVASSTQTTGPAEKIKVESKKQNVDTKDLTILKPKSTERKNAVAEPLDSGKPKVTDAPKEVASSTQTTGPAEKIKVESKKQNVDTKDLTILKPKSTERKNAVAEPLDSGKPKVTDAPKEVASSTQTTGPRDDIKLESIKENVDTKDLKIPKPESTETKNAVAKRLDSGKPKVTDAPKEVASSTQTTGPAEKIKVESKKQNVDTKDLTILKPKSTERKNAVAEPLDSGKPKVTDAPKEVASSTQTTGPAEKIKVESKKQNVDTKDLTILKPKSTERKNAVAEPLDSGKPKVTDAPKEVASSTQTTGPRDDIKLESIKENVDTKDLKIPKSKGTEAKNAVAKPLDSGKPKVTDAPKEVASSTQTPGPAEKIKVESKKQNVDTEDLTIPKPESTETKNAVAEPLDSGEPKVTDAPKEVASSTQTPGPAEKIKVESKKQNVDTEDLTIPKPESTETKNAVAEPLDSGEPKVTDAPKEVASSTQTPGAREDIKVESKKQNVDTEDLTIPKPESTETKNAVAEPLDSGEPKVTDAPKEVASSTQTPGPREDIKVESKKQNVDTEDLTIPKPKSTETKNAVAEPLDSGEPKVTDAPKEVASSTQTPGPAEKIKVESKKQNVDTKDLKILKPESTETKNAVAKRLDSGKPKVTDAPKEVASSTQTTGPAEKIKVESKKQNVDTKDLTILKPKSTERKNAVAEPLDSGKPKVTDAPKEVASSTQTTGPRDDIKLESIKENVDTKDLKIPKSKGTEAKNAVAKPLDSGEPKVTDAPKEVASSTQTPGPAEKIKVESKKQNVDTEDLTIPKPESTETKNAVAEPLDSGEPKVTDAPKEVASSTQTPGAREDIKVESKKQNVDTEDLTIPKPKSTETKNAVAEPLDSGEPKVTDAPKEVASSTQTPGAREDIKVESIKKNVDTEDLTIPKPKSTETKNAVAEPLDSGEPKVTDAPKEVASSTQTPGPAEKVKVEFIKENIDTEDLTILKPKSTEIKTTVAEPLDSGEPKVTDAPKEVASSTQTPGPAEKIKVESIKKNVDTKDLKIPKPESTETKNAVAEPLDSGEPKVTDSPKEVASSTQTPRPAEKIKVESKKQNVDTEDLTIPKPESTETKNAVAEPLDSGKPKVTDAPKEVESSTQTPGPAEKIKVESRKQNVDTEDLTIPKPESTKTKNAVAEPLDSGKPKVTDAPKEIASSTQTPGPAEKIKVESKKQNVDTEDLTIPKPESTETKNAVAEPLDSGKPKVTDAPKEVASSTQTPGPAEKIKVESKKQNVDTEDLTIPKPESTETKNAVAEPLDSGEPKVTDAPKEVASSTQTPGPREDIKVESKKQNVDTKDLKILKPEGTEIKLDNTQAIKLEQPESTIPVIEVPTAQQPSEVIELKESTAKAEDPNKNDSLPEKSINITTETPSTKTSKTLKSTGKSLFISESATETPTVTSVSSLLDKIVEAGEINRTTAVLTTTASTTSVDLPHNKQSKLVVTDSLTTAIPQGITTLKSIETKTLSMAKTYLRLIHPTSTSSKETPVKPVSIAAATGGAVAALGAALWVVWKLRSDSEALEIDVVDNNEPLYHWNDKQDSIGT